VTRVGQAVMHAVNHPGVEPSRRRRDGGQVRLWCRWSAALRSVRVTGVRSAISPRRCLCSRRSPVDDADGPLDPLDLGGAVSRAEQPGPHLDLAESPSPCGWRTSAGWRPCTGPDRPAAAGRDWDPRRHPQVRTLVGGQAVASGPDSPPDSRQRWSPSPWRWGCSSLDGGGLVRSRHSVERADSDSVRDLPHGLRSTDTRNGGET
jgi:hypothetical protein